MDVAKMPNGLAAILVARVVAGSARTLVALAEIRGAFGFRCFTPIRRGCS